MQRVNVKEIKWYMYFLLFFVKTKYRNNKYDNIQIKYKKVFGEIYILDMYEIPPFHVNCKCRVYHGTS